MKIQQTNDTAIKLNEYGGVVIRSVIVVLTLLVVGIALFGIMNHVGSNQQIYHRKALAISEYGLMKAMQHVKTGISEFSDIPKTECDEGWYTVTFKKYDRNDTVFLEIISKGNVGPTSETRGYLLHLDRLDTIMKWVPYHPK